MEALSKPKGFFRKKSPVAGVIFTVILVFILFCILFCLFAARSALALLSGSGIQKTVTTMLDDDTFRNQVAETIIVIAPEDTLVGEQVAEVMKEEVVADAIGQLGSDWFTEVLEDEGSLDPVDAVLDVLENPENKDTFEEALAEAMKQLEYTTEDLRDAASSLSDELGFELPEEDSTDLEIVTTILDGSREKIQADTTEVIKTVEKAKEVVSETSSLLSLLGTLFGTAVFVLINVLLLLFFYGLTLLLVRSLWKPCYYLSVPYLLTGTLLMCTKALDAPALAASFDLPPIVGTALNAVLDSVFTTGLIGVIIGAALMAVAITFNIVVKVINNKKEDIQVCSVPNAEVN